MGFDLSVKFSNPAWYPLHRDRVAQLARALPSASDRSPGPAEIWLKDPASTDPWDYQVRILVTQDVLWVEVTAFSEAFHRDVRSLVSQLGQETPVELVDDDGEPV